MHIGSLTKTKRTHHSEQRRRTYPRWGRIAIRTFILQVAASDPNQSRTTPTSASVVTMTAHAEVLDGAYVRDRAFMVALHLKARGISGPLLLACRHGHGATRDLRGRAPQTESRQSTG